MKTVDVLIRARDLISDKKNWGRHSLAVFHGNGEDITTKSDDELKGLSSFCVLGACMVAGNLLRPNAERAPYRATLYDTNGFCSIGPFGGITIDGQHHFGNNWSDDAWRCVSKAVRKSLADDGVGVMSVAKAIMYLDAAALRMYGKHHYSVNDTLNHEDVLAIMDLAIKNAKRRHINGKRTKEEC